MTSTIDSRRSIQLIHFICSLLLKNYLPFVEWALLMGVFPVAFVFVLIAYWCFDLGFEGVGMLVLLVLLGLSIATIGYLSIWSYEVIVTYLLLAACQVYLVITKL